MCMHYTHRDPGTRTQCSRVIRFTFKKQCGPGPPWSPSWQLTSIQRATQKTVVPKEGLFVFWVPHVSNEYKVGLYPCYLSLEPLQIGIGRKKKKKKRGNITLRWDFHINTSEIVRCSLNFFPKWDLLPRGISQGADRDRLCEYWVLPRPGFELLCAAGWQLH